MKSLIFLAALTFSCLAFANNWYDRGNGGFAIVCADKNTPQVLDLYELTERHGLKPAFSAQQSAEEKAVDLLSRLNALDPARAKAYKMWIRDFFSATVFVTSSSEFVKTPDVGLVTLPLGCKLEQVVFQRNPSILNKSRYVVNSNLWNQLDSNQQAALIIHEVIYREFMSSPTLETTSERIRVYNAILHSDGFLGISLQEYLNLLQELHFTTYDYQGLPLSLGYADTNGVWRTSPVTFESDFIQKAKISGRSSFERPYFKFYCNDATSTPELGTATLNSNGNLTSLQVSPDFSQKNECPLPFLTSRNSKGDITISGTSWNFVELEKPITIAGPLSTSEQFQLNYGGTNFVLAWDPFRPVTVEAQFVFDREMNLREIALGGTACRSPINQSIIFAPKNFISYSVVVLDEQGAVTSELKSCF